MEDETQKYIDGRGGKREGSGAKTKYYPELGQEMIDFFDRKPYEAEVVYDEEGNKRVVKAANDFPSFEGFAASKKLARKSLYVWRDKYEEFMEAWEQCEAIQHNFIMVNGMAGLTVPAFTIFAAKNIMGRRDKQDVNNTGETTVRTIIIDSVDAEL